MVSSMLACLGHGYFGFCVFIMLLYQLVCVYPLFVYLEYCFLRRYNMAISVSTHTGFGHILTSQLFCVFII